MKKARLFFTALAALLAGTVASAQVSEVSGTVTDASNGEPVAGAAVQLVGSTTTFALTDAFGGYTINTPKDGVLHITCLGFKDVEIAVSGRAVVDIKLEPDSQMIEETIVVAYGTVKREAVTGSVSSVKGDQLSTAPITSIDKAISGKMAGVQVGSSSGQPGATSSIRIRGYSSINASNSPLWVVDGIPVVSGDVAMYTNTSNQQAIINPNDVESITILKDAAAAAAYGSRAANGVILVTTKSGKEGKTSFDARAKMGVSWLKSDSGFRLMTAQELLGYQRDAIINAGLDPDDPTGTLYRPLDLLSGELTNWMDEFTRLGRLEEYEINARGGNSKSKYYSSLSYHKNEGVFYGVDYERFQARVNSDYKLLDNLTTGVKINVAYTSQNDIAMGALYNVNPMFAGPTLLPWIPLYDENGEYNMPSSNANLNPLATAKYDEQWQKGYNFNGVAFLRYEPIKNLVLESKNAAEISYNNSRAYQSPQANPSLKGTGTAYGAQWFFTQYTTSNTATYSNVFDALHSVRVVLGHEASSLQNEQYIVTAPGVNPDIPYITTANQKETSNGYAYARETRVSFFSIADYNYDNRYFLQANIREDGSSLFGANRKWGLFWSVSGSWNISNESFLRDIKAIDLLKVRASYGVNGNDGISAYRAYGLYSTSPYNGIAGFLASQPSNEDLTWETNKTWDLGADFGFLGRIHGTIDVYNRKTEDMLLAVSVPQTTGFSSNFRNVGSLSNKGIEFQIDADIVNNGDIYANVGFNISHNKSEILDLGGIDAVNPSDYIAQYRVGHPMYEWYLRDYAGVNPTNGESLYFTENGDITNDYNAARRVYCGSPEPKAIGGFNGTFAWKGLSVSAFFEYKVGTTIYLEESILLNTSGKYMDFNQMVSALNYWKKPGDVGVNPKPVANGVDSGISSSRYLERGDYLRLKDITLSYSFDKSVLNLLHLKGLKIYASGLNLYCWNDVNYYDPEVGLTGDNAGMYPLTKSVVGGIEVTF